MTRDDAIGVLRVLTAAWPNANLSDDTVELWIEYLASVNHDQGRMVASELVLAEQWMPTIARFREAVVAKRRNDAARSNYATPALPSGSHPTTPEEARAHIGELRAVLASASRDEVR